ncbi:DNA mismatch repair protein MutS [Lacinutrix sp. C3R15]|uniref:MutS-related protein n=1 Tax=Flavobacteriaceae TaxID=49546 RepID=UPI001C098311|nr:MULTISPECIES: DNA mismatch repair protein MutS [Flavobacteriaceae]MBU2940843.1 DNA mismatch repair protein MutS [Lacinutrix sp. C3R15]MDO6624161.1 DNA mismatch repair protein MutS [Oceanihabitans sp. 1_MG-2023]
MQDSNTFYKQEKEQYTLEAKQLFKQLTSLSLVRFVVFVATAIGVYYTFNTAKIVIPIALLGIAVFIYLLSKYTDLKYQHKLKKALITINEEELKIASGDFKERETGLQYQNPNHAFSLDIDLFGKGSFFQFINRTATEEGTKALVQALTANNIENINLRQEAIKELANKPKWRQHFKAVASLIKIETPAIQIIEWLKAHTSFLPKVMRVLPLAFTIGSAIVLLLAIFEVISFLFLGYWLLIGLGISGIYLKKINILAANTDKVKDVFKQYASLLQQIESESFTSSLLKEKQAYIQQEEKKASLIFKQFSKNLDALDNRNNLISAIFGNGFFLSDLRNAYAIEQWIAQYKTTVAHWFEVVAFFDAYNTFGAYTFNHQEYVFPEIVANDTVLEAKNLGHPLLDASKRVASDLTITDQQFFIVTGANMAGKSTFLRTVSLHIVMANVGLPICATSSIYNPIKLITSMRTSDSLTDDSSYFFSELTRLKFIVDALQEDRYFIILDEILKGTNSTDKAIGSRKFVEKLVSKNAIGIIATHDLSLCEIEKELDEVKNYYFDAEIVNDELYFDYKLKQGICQNMNASFLLKKMEIV